MSAPTPVLLSWSGGKDSALALSALRQDRERNVVGLLTTVTADFNRISMHGVRSSLLEAQTASLGLPLLRVEIPPASSDSTYGARMATALEQARDQGVQHVAFGDLFLHDVREYREAMLAKVGMAALFPLWGLPTDDLAKRFIQQGYRAILTCVDTTQVPGDLVGREFDQELLQQLPPSADPCGENGEFHTFVFDGPGFGQPIGVERGARVLRDQRFMYQDLLPVDPR